METFANHVGAGSLNPSAAYVALAAVAVSFGALVLLHILSPELAPSWRMVSEYANGGWPWLLTVVFAAWALSSFALVAAIWPVSATILGKAGLAFLVIAGVGQAMGGFFDINHKLHGPAAMIGIPSLCVAAVLLTWALRRLDGFGAPPFWSAHLPWISFGLMFAAFAMFFASLKAAGVDVSSQSTPLQELPAGVSGYVGWANRLLFATSYLWVMLTSLAVVRAST